MKKGFLDGYETYDPDAVGYGSPNQWRKAFRQRMSPDQAKEILEEDDPFVILGLKIEPGVNKVAKKDIKLAYYAMAIRWHPDKNLDNVLYATERMKKINAAYDLLCDRFGY